MFTYKTQELCCIGKVFKGIKFCLFAIYNDLVKIYFNFKNSNK